MPKFDYMQWQKAERNGEARNESDALCKMLRALSRSDFEVTGVKKPCESAPPPKT